MFLINYFLNHVVYLAPNSNFKMVCRIKKFKTTDLISICAKIYKAIEILKRLQINNFTIKNIKKIKHVIKCTKSF